VVMARGRLSPLVGRAPTFAGRGTMVTTKNMACNLRASAVLDRMPSPPRVGGRPGMLVLAALLLLAARLGSRLLSECPGSSAYLCVVMSCFFLRNL